MSQPKPRTGVPPNPDQAAVDPHKELWKHIRSKKLITTPQGERFILDIEIIVAGVTTWNMSDQSSESDWNVVILAGIVIAERTIA